MNSAEIFKLEDSETDYRGPEEVRIWIGSNGTGVALDLDRSDLETMIREMDRLWKLDQFYGLLNDEFGMDEDAFHDAVKQPENLAHKLMHRLADHRMFISEDEAVGIVLEVVS